MLRRGARMAWVRIVRFGQTVPVRSPSKPSLALFSVGESRLAAAIARPVAPLLGFALVAVLVMLTGAVPAHAKVTVTVSEEVVARGETAMIRAAVRPKAKFCTYWLKGKTRKMLSTKRVRNGQSTLRYVTKALVPGTYRVTVYCGKSGKGSARLKVGDTTPATTPVPDPIVPPTSSPQPPLPPLPPPASQAATCSVAESGGRYRPTDRVAAAGIRLSNTSTGKDATWIEVTANFWSGDTIVATENRYLERIPAGQSLFVGFDSVYVDRPITKLSSFATCKSEPAGAARQVVGGTATAVPTVLDDIDVQGQFTNTYPFTLSSLAAIDYVTRGSDGKINGGGFTFTSSRVPVGATMGWQIHNPAFSPTELPASIEFTVEPEPA